jgi:uncharacterized damage-inducible protein DinB
MNMEPWMEGGITDLDPLRAGVLYSFRHASRDVSEWIARVDEEKLQIRYGQLASAASQVRHIAGSVDRLVTYAAGHQLSEAQLQQLRLEEGRPATRAALLEELGSALSSAEARIRSFDPASYSVIREIGRRRVPVPLGVLLVHIAEHTQRHVGQLIMTIKVMREEYR